MAVTEQGAVQELHVERGSSRGLVGNIYLGRVCRVLPGMQSAFVEIGLPRAAFLHVADIWSARNGNGDAKPIEKITRSRLCATDCSIVVTVNGSARSPRMKSLSSGRVTIAESTACCTRTAWRALAVMTMSDSCGRFSA